VIVVVVVVGLVVRSRKMDAAVQEICDIHIYEENSMQKLEKSNPNHSPSVKRLPKRRRIGT
jgi:hypothetical protein